MNFRDYQTTIMDKAKGVLLAHRFVYLSMQVRTGKTLTAMGVAQELSIKRMLFVTKKKAISSIEADYKKLNPNYEIVVINYESLHKVQGRFDFMVIDEAHSIGALPKPSNRAKKVKELIALNQPYVVLMSGTPTPESFSQMYHQVYGCPNNPFRSFKNFYAFARVHVNVYEKKLGHHSVNVYLDGKQSILDEMKPYMISYTQKEAGFKVQTNEHVLTVKLKPRTYEIIKELKRDKVVENEKVKEVILADTGVKEMSKVHQLCSGTVKFESGASMVLDKTKAEFIRTKFKNMKLGIFYKFTAEYKALKEVYGDDLTNDLEDFKTTPKSIALQIVSGREGISLKEADCLVYYNIDFSALSYWQSRDRMTTKDTMLNDVYWIFADGGIEKSIYRTVTKKKDYTLQHFKKDLLSL